MPKKGHKPQTRVIAIVGPTAAGKTRLAVELAQKLDAEIISCDSRAIYKKTHALTAVPEGKWQQGMFVTKEGVPYHLVDFIDPAKRWNAYSHAKEARSLIETILKRKPWVIVAGGSGLYYQAIFRGLSLLPPAKHSVRKKLESTLQKSGLPALQAMLKERDPRLYQEIDIHNPRRIIRALELCELLKGPASKHLRNKESLAYPYKSFYLHWPKEALQERIAKRIHEKFRDMVREVKHLHQNFGTDIPAWEALLAPSIYSYISKNTSREEAIHECIKRDAHLAKRQVTWFKKEPRLTILPMAREKSCFTKAAKQIMLNSHE